MKKFIMLLLFILLLCSRESHGSRVDHARGHIQLDNRVGSMLPQIAPVGAPQGLQPFLPLIAPSPLTPFTNITTPKLSGLCTLNFTTAKSLLSVTAIDCWGFFAPVLANVICCPQLEATLTVLVGQSSKYTNVLALNGTTAKHCLSDVEQILMGQGANGDLKQICSVNSLNLTEASCPVKHVNDFYDMVNTAKLLSACENIDPVKECCYQNCHNAILEAATKIASKGSNVLDSDASHVLPEHSIRVNDCRNIVLRWIASKLDPSHGKKVLRGLSNCNINKVCPLVLPDAKHVAQGCGNGISNKTACCGAMESYVSHLQKQSFITNLQALGCAESLAMKLKKLKIVDDVYSLCHISLKDFSLQVANQEYGCLLPSLPSDAVFDQTSGVSFICDLNDNIPAPWPSASQGSSSTSCNKTTVIIPALPAAAASGQNCLYSRDVLIFLLVNLFFLVMALV
ncbi:uncharacterized GPI-anchored protein At1g61900-like isoform X1 [Vicia villosa]|uniref:uncharacterized GPI-anchored protein At1g61900-like isoform X1 n=1 Tax=Vicia villosa TaxID=3911 RepID=UPI00273C0FDC|nr:uncharacterized GPI-anchored protein At1g61900-like isoform X1 [Vicia villosa]